MLFTNEIFTFSLPKTENMREPNDDTIMITQVKSLNCVLANIISACLLYILNIPKPDWSGFAHTKIL